LASFIACRSPSAICAWAGRRAICRPPCSPPPWRLSHTLVMGPGGYRFGDYWKLGLPLSIIVLVAGVPPIMAFWPLGQ
jgi:hypothetical protein